MEHQANARDRAWRPTARVAFGTSRLQLISGYNEDLTAAFNAASLFSLTVTGPTTDSEDFQLFPARLACAAIAHPRQQNPDCQYFFEICFFEAIGSSIDYDKEGESSKDGLEYMITRIMTMVLSGFAWTRARNKYHDVPSKPIISKWKEGCARYS